MEQGPAHFYYVERGTMWGHALGGALIQASRGDMVLLPRATSHVIGDDPATAPAAIGSVIGPHCDRNKSVLEYGGAGELNSVVGGDLTDG